MHMPKQTPNIMLHSRDHVALQKNIARLWKHISPIRRTQFATVLLLTIVTSVTEVVSISAILPFLSILTAPESFFSHPSVGPIVHALGIDSPKHMVAPLAICFGVAALIASGARLTLLQYSTRVSFATGADLSLDVYSRTLHQPYLTHISRNSSEVITGISTKVTNVIYGVLIPLLTLLSSTVMLLAILAALIMIDPWIALASICGFGMIYALIVFKTRKKLVLAGQAIAQQSTQTVRNMQEGLGGIRDILINRTQKQYCEAYQNADLLLREAQASNQVISQSPRYVVEALGMILIAGIACLIVAEPQGSARVIPILGALALGAQRMLPTLQQIYASWSTILGSQASLIDTLRLLEQPLPVHSKENITPLAFHSSIQLKDIAFGYEESCTPVLRKINLRIPKGGRIGIIGPTGSGKSTLVDIITGLLSPTSGSLEVDGVVVGIKNVQSWQMHIAHVPQHIFLSDASIAENIALGIPKEAIDYARVKHAADLASIADTIESWPQGYQTRTGERGVMLSGGQRQRIGIARAFYKSANVIILDEATSALDGDTERSIVESIQQMPPELTVLMIAHRLTTLQHCSHIIEIGNGVVAWQGTYAELMNRQT